MPRGVKAARGTRNSISDRPGWLPLLLRRQRWMLRPAAWGGFAVLLVLLGFTLLRSAAPGGALDRLRQGLAEDAAGAGMRVSHIVIEGRANTPEPVLRAALDVRIGEPIMGVSISKAQARIERLSWVDHATVERRLPGTIVVRLIERRPFAIWQDHGTFTLIDRAGNVVTNRNVADFRTLPLVVGPGAPEAAARLIDALNAAPDIARRMEAAVRVADRRWNLLLKSGLTVRLPEGHVVAAITRLVALDQKFDLLDRPLRFVDLRLPNLLVVRPIEADATPDTGKPGAHPSPGPARKPT
ncbi:MAG: FtsQ-type POTRA domain-containing protein [Proteobacteria bacterium]|nr:FtsQ-type POTRA domain-containing protein [Pseudomonadota bacterium]